MIPNLLAGDAKCKLSNLFRKVSHCEIGDQVSELIDPKNNPDDSFAGLSRLGDLERKDVLDLWTEFAGGGSFGKPRGNRCEDVSAMEGLANGLHKKTVLYQMINPQISFLLQGGAENPIVRPDKEIILGLDQQRAAKASNAGIHHSNVDCSFWEEMKAGSESDGASQNVLRCDPMGNVNNLAIRMNTENNSFHDADVGIVQPKVRGEGNQKMDATGLH